MRKILIAVLLLALAVGLFSCRGNDENGDSNNQNGAMEDPNFGVLELDFEKTADGRYYTVIGIGTFTNAENIHIPNTYNGKEVKSISDGAFSGRTNIKTVTVEDGVEKIGANAFYGCASLEVVTISKSLEKIGSSAFENCTSLKHLMFGSGVSEIGKNAFLGCSSIDDFYYEGSVSDFGKIAGIVSSELGYKTRYIYSSEYPIAAGYFWHWSDSKDVAVWEDYIGNEGLKFELDEGGKYYKVIGNSNTTDKKVVIPRAHKGLPVGEIDAMAFINASLREIVISDTVRKISGAAFKWCSNLVSITMPNSLEFIGDSAFSGCTALEDVEIPDSVKKIGNDAFYGCEALCDVKLGKGLDEIGERAFYRCIALEHIEIPKLVKVLKNGVFADCSALWQIILHSQITDIEINAFPASVEVYYESNSEDFEKINVGEDNLWLENVYLYSETEPDTEGKFWYRGEDGEINVW